MSKPEERTEVNVRTVVAELRRARQMYDKIDHAWTGITIILDRTNKLLIALKNLDTQLARKRATQVAAMAIRFMDDLFKESEV